MVVFVITANDYPVGVLTDRRQADKLAADMNALNKVEGNTFMWWKVHDFNLNDLSQCRR